MRRYGYGKSLMVATLSLAAGLCMVPSSASAAAVPGPQQDQATRPTDQAPGAGAPVQEQQRLQRMRLLRERLKNAGWNTDDPAVRERIRRILLEREGWGPPQTDNEARPETDTNQPRTDQFPGRRGRGPQQPQGQTDRPDDFVPQDGPPAVRQGPGWQQQGLQQQGRQRERLQRRQPQQPTPPPPQPQQEVRQILRRLRQQMDQNAPCPLCGRGPAAAPQRRQGLLGQPGGWQQGGPRPFQQPLGQPWGRAFGPVGPPRQQLMQMRRQGMQRPMMRMIPRRNMMFDGQGPQFGDPASRMGMGLGMGFGPAMRGMGGPQCPLFDMPRSTYFEQPTPPQPPMGPGVPQRPGNDRPARQRRGQDNRPI